MSSLPVERPLRRRFVRGRAAVRAGWVRRNGVALTVLSGLILIALLALTQGGLAMLAVARFNTSFGRVANTTVPNLISASSLAALSQSLVARAPQLAAAASQTERQEIGDRLNDRLTALGRVIDRSALDPAQLRDVRSQLDGLKTSLEALDGFVRQRIDADNAFKSVMARLPALAAQVRQVADDTAMMQDSGEADRDSARTGADRRRVIGWSAASLEGVTLMLATPAIDSKSRVERVNAEFQMLVGRMRSLRDQLPPQLRQKISGVDGNIVAFGSGDRNIFRAREAQIEAGTAIETSLRFINQAIDRFVASVSQVLKVTQQEVGGRSQRIGQTVARFNFLIMATLVLCVIVGAAIFAYVRRAVILRLKHVQEYMRAQVEGRTLAMSTGGADEIAEIAQSTQIFVTRIAAARDAAEEARHTAEAAYRDLKAAQAKLIHAEKMASLGLLTAGIAHEIKNPLNFVNNFAGLSIELLEELKETAAPGIASLDNATRSEIDDTVQLLTSNLDKIAQHGKRADGIVKSMLEHSRSGAGERREVDLNALLDEALNLAYHGARAQDQSFNIGLERDYEESLRPIELAPQEMTRVFLNLIGNGFYAANNRARANGGAAYRPTLRVATRETDEGIEVRVRDNGTGIPPEIRDKLFQPFFTTKPTGEGTGLGLSISYDIVTQQHGGTIAVESEPGAYTEFIIRLPRRKSVSVLGGRG